MLRIFILLFALYFSIPHISSVQAQEIEYNYDVDSLDKARSTYVEFLANIAFGPDETFMYEGGFGILTEIADNVRLGVADVTYTNADQLEGSRHAIGFGPAVEFFKRTSENVALQARFGVPLQIRWGADIDSKLGIQPYAQGGINFYVAREFSIGLIARGAIVATNGYVRSPRVLPESAIALSGGLDFKYHF